MSAERGKRAGRAKTANLEFHPLRADLYQELHSRPFQVIPSQARITQIAVLTTPEQRQHQFEHLQKLHRLLGEPWPEQETSCYEQTFGNLRIRREVHMEFTSYTFINTADSPANPFTETGLTLLPDGWLEQLAGTVVGAFHIEVRPSSEDAQSELAFMRKHFEGMRLVGSRPQEGAARILGSFQLHSDNFGRFMVLNQQMSNSQLGRLVQRLMEIENYRLMSLLALPLARELTPDLNLMDRQLAHITQSLANNENLDEQQLLAELTNISARIEAFRARTTFRFSATGAYHELVLARLEELREEEVSGHLTLTEFMTRRLTPAVKTCEAVGERLEDLSRRIDRTSEMMRTRVDLAIQSQNQQLLSSMDRRSRIQLMMQHTVEGFSVVAISYYLIGLLKLALEALKNGGVEINSALVTGLAIPLVMVLVFFGIRLIHHRFLRMARRQ
ncbi:DUF3422 domain-containing protein [Marinobacter fuscus]|uniref:DUF3422 domain-containing protein n=1 Tax=Marinobacter fuscus TaxID=2109942 RepID=A0A2T1K6F0_9GAMM|nr:DUF3422 domain-containing protein [Marinobacter fuscus]PSF05092.1 DUF3422 domain-containing protein [Marinobacter fuscus]